MNTTPQQQQTNNDDIILDRINAMRLQEDDDTSSTIQIKNYVTAEVDEACRKAMIDWCFTVVDAFNLSRESVAISMSLLDRYLSSNNGKSVDVLQSKQQFQLAAITCFYIAVKIYEPVQLGIAMLLKLCRGYYKQNDIVSMEQDILSALDYRVYISTTTPMEYVRHYLDLLSEWNDLKDVILENARSHSDNATLDVYFSTCKVSSVGIACLAGALDDESIDLTELEKQVIWSQLSRKLGYDIASNEIRTVEKRLLSKISDDCCEPRSRISQASLPRTSMNMASEQSSSPVSVMQMAR